MIKETTLSLSTDLVSAVWTAEGELTTFHQKILKIWVASPISSSKYELGFFGPLGDSIFERIKDSLASLPSLHEAQIIVNRRKKRTGAEAPQKNSLFPDTGLETRIYIIELAQPQATNNLSHILENIGMKLEPGTRQNYVELLSTFLGQGKCKEELILPDLLWEEDHLKSGKQYLKVASLTDLPLSTWNNCFEALSHQVEEFVCSLKISMPDKLKTRKSLETKRRVSHALSARKAHELSDLESGSNLNSSEEILLRMTQGKEQLLNISMALVMNDESLALLETRMQAFISDLNGGTGAGFFVESLGTLPVLKSHLAGGAHLSVRDLPILSGNLAQIMPIFLDYSREQDAASLNFVSRCGEVSHLNFMSSGNLNFNSFTAGASGSGKSFLMNSMLASFKTDHPQGNITIFDVGGSYKKIVKHLGGTTFDLTGESAIQLIASALKRLTLQPNGFCKTLLENLCGGGNHITHSHKVAIEDLLQCCEGAPFSLKTLSNEANERSERAYRDIVLWLRPYLAWDHIQGSPDAERVLVDRLCAFDFKGLESDPLLQRLAILILTKGIWDRLKKDSSQPSLIVFDEVWKFFAQASSFLEEMYRTFRKYRAGIASVTQSLSDYGNDTFAKVVIANSFHRIFLQGAANSTVLSNVLDINESDRTRILSLASVKNEFSEFWLGTPQFSQILRLYPSQELYDFANSENISSQKEVSSCV